MINRKKSWRLIYLLFLLLVTSLASVQCQNQSSIIKDQKNLLGILTGAKPIKEGTTLASRSTDEERVLTQEFLIRQLNKLGVKAQTHSYQVPNRNPNSKIKEFKGKNIYATLESTSGGDEYVIIGAHFDSVPDCPGANDNATGVAMALEVFKYVSTSKDREYNLILVLFDQEERGLVGSSAFAKMILDQGMKVHSVHTVDQMGWDKDGDRAVELEVPTAYLEKQYRNKAKELKIPIHISDVDATDHRAFRKLGFKAIGLTEEYKNKDTTPHYHRSTDTFETIDFDYLASSTVLMSQVIQGIVVGDN